MMENNSKQDRRFGKKLWWQLPFLLLLILGTIFIVIQQRSAPYQHEQGFVFGTVYTITYQSEKSLKNEIEQALQQVDQEFSMFNEHSTVSQVNRGENPTLSNMFIEVFRMAESINADTEGCFDVTVAPLVNAWGFGFKHETLPSAGQVDSLRDLVGMKRLTFNEKENKVQKADARMMLDFSAIAKGYGSDYVARLLKNHGVKNYMVEIGGEVVTKGVSPNRLPWRIGVTKPTEDSLNTSNELQTVLNITDMSMATSGNYRNFYYEGGRKYAHTINPLTGYPVQHSLLSATVLSSSCAKADAYATSFMVMGLERAKQVLERHSDMMAYLIYTDEEDNYAVWYSPALRDKIN